MILLIDNYDSFTYNLSDYLHQLGVNVTVVKNDEWQINQIIQSAPSAIVLSPGPGTPDDSGITLEVIRYFAGIIPLFGVCLGHQAIAQAFGGRIIRTPHPVHGKTAMIYHDNKTLFNGLPQPLQVARYHSLQVDPTTLPAEFTISAQTSDGVIMAMRHKTLAIESVQFHPEAIQTQCGLMIIRHFLTFYTNEVVI